MKIITSFFHLLKSKLQPPISIFPRIFAYYFQSLMKAPIYFAKCLKLDDLLSLWLLNSLPSIPRFQYASLLIRISNCRFHYEAQRLILEFSHSYYGIQLHSSSSHHATYCICVLTISNAKPILNNLFHFVSTQNFQPSVMISKDPFNHFQILLENRKADCWNYVMNLNKTFYFF